MPVDERMWKIVQRHLGYTDEQMKVFRSNPRNEEVVAKGKEVMQKRIVFEVVESHGCNSQHKVGDKFTFDGAGNLLTESCPKKVCAFSISMATNMIYAASEMIYAGADPNTMRFRRASCYDVGLECGGWGHVVLEMHVEEQA